MPTIEETIMEMGFSEERAKKALNKTGWSGVEQAMEWLLSHPEGEDEDDDDEMDTGDQSAQPVPAKVLTPEEREAKMKELEELRAVKRKEREEKEKKEALEREKRRIEDGKKMTEIKQDMANKEMIRAAEERRREKLETLAVKEKVKLQIQADREAKKRELLAMTGGAQPEAPPKPAPPAPVAAAAPSRSYDEAKLQIRLTNGKALVQTFNAKEPLSAVRLYVQLHRDDIVVDRNAPVQLMTNFPKKVFSFDDYDKPLSQLGLVPSAVIMVMK